MRLRDITAILPTRGGHHGLRDDEELSRFARWRAAVSDKLARSSRVFLFGLIVACGIEVLVDWNQTLFEINVLRNAIRQKGESYVGILAKASDDELAGSDRAGLERLSHGIFDDEDAVYVRFTDAAGKVLWDKVQAEHEKTWRKRGFTDSFVEHYARLMGRDIDSILRDPEGFKSRLATSKYKDFAQSWTDAMDKVIALMASPKPPTASRGLIVYQDRLRDDNHQKDDKISYALGTVLGNDGRDIGAVLVAFDMKRTNDAVRGKYLKFGGLAAFFIILILVQSTVSRRNRLRLMDLEERYATAKKALREAMPREAVRSGALSASGAIDQAKGHVDGMVWNAADEGDSLLVVAIDPDGDGIDAAAVGLHVIRTYLARRKDGTRPTLEEELKALGEAALGIPLTRPLGTLLLRVDSRTGAYQALLGSTAELRVHGGSSSVTIDPEPSDGEIPDGIVGPLQVASGMLEQGKSIVGFFTGTSKKGTKAFGEALAGYIQRTHEPGERVPVEDTAIWARGKNPALAENDIAILAITRDMPSSKEADSTGQSS